MRMYIEQDLTKLNRVLSGLNISLGVNFICILWN